MLRLGHLNMESANPIEDLLDRWDAALDADLAINPADFVKAEGLQLDESLRAEFVRRAEGIARIKRQLDRAVAVSSQHSLTGSASESRPPPASDFQAGMEPVPGYTLVAFLGKGGCGEVWRAQAPGGMPVALKILASDRATTYAELEALETLKGVHHPHLLAIHAFWLNEGRLFIASELADCTLLTRLEQSREAGERGIPVQELLGYMQETAKALDFLNSPQRGRREIGHGDIKPPNLLLSGGSIKVGDFGLIRALSNGTADHRGGLTPLYAAPEFFRGKIFRTSDQYSLAVTYCHLRTGRPSSHKASVVGGPTGAPHLTDLLPREQRVVTQALSKWHRRRFRNCKQFIDRLAAAHEDRGSELRGWQKAAASLVVLIAVAALAFTWARYRTPISPPDLVISEPQPPGPAEPSLSSLETHERKWRQISDHDTDDARWVASPLILSVHAGLRGKHAEERNLLGLYWERFTRVAKPAKALSFAREIAELLPAEEKFFAETVDSGEYFSIDRNDLQTPLAPSLRPHLHWPRFSRLWPFDYTLRMMKHSIDYATPPMRGMVESQFRGRIAQRPYDYLEEVLNPGEVFEALHPGVYRHHQKINFIAIEADTVAWLADVVAYCTAIPTPPEQVRRDVGELQSNLLRVAEDLTDHSMPHPSLVRAAEKILPVLEAMATGASTEDDRSTADKLRSRFSRIAAPAGNSGEGVP